MAVVAAAAVVVVDDENAAVVVDVGIAKTAWPTCHVANVLQLAGPPADVEPAFLLVPDCWQQHQQYLC